MLYRAEELPILPIRNAMERQRGSSNLDAIITHNLSDTYSILMIQNCPSSCGHEKQMVLITI